MNWLILSISLFWAIVGLACLTHLFLAIQWVLSLFPVIGTGFFLALLALIIVGFLTFLIYKDINN